ncbi:MAG TPA: FtsQ-type POTRA domain-containing protein [Kofleriaceae bacterium]|nr:FtsQ-type POTRA domain-containing protein [Kofleriaceae bacterium]
MIADACGRALRRTLPALIALFILAAIGGTAWAGYRFVTTSSRFAITTIEVNGVEQLTADQIRALSAIRIGDNVFATNLDAVTHEVRENPWIASAEAHRVLPHTIVIDVREHVAAAVVQLGGLYLVDADGHPFKRAELGSEDGAGLPIITGLDRETYLANPAGTAAQIRSAMAALVKWRGVEDRPSVGEVHLDPHGALTLVTYEHAIAIQLGDMDAALDQRMQTFDATWAELTSAERARTRAIHLDARADQVTVAFAPTDHT